MLRKTFVLLIAMAAVVAAVAMIPGSASGKFICSKGQPHNSTYCMTVCVVPKVVGRHLKKAKQMIKANNCSVGKITKQDKDKQCDKRNTTCTTAAQKKAHKREHGYEKGIVVKQKPAGGSGSGCQPGIPTSPLCLAKGTKVNLTVEF